MRLKRLMEAAGADWASGEQRLMVFMSAKSRQKVDDDGGVAVISDRRRKEVSLVNRSICDE